MEDRMYGISDSNLMKVICLWILVARTAGAALTTSSLLGRGTGVTRRVSVAAAVRRLGVTAAAMRRVAGE
jgi:hypothetical protein